MTNTASFVLEFLIITWLKGTDRPTVIQVHQLTCPGQPKTMTSLEFWLPPAQWKEFPEKHSVRPDIRLCWYNPVEKALITTNCQNSFTDSRGAECDNVTDCYWKTLLLVISLECDCHFDWLGYFRLWTLWKFWTLWILCQIILRFENINHHKDHRCLFKQS